MKKNESEIKGFLNQVSDIAYKKNLEENSLISFKVGKNSASVEYVDIDFLGYKISEMDVVHYNLTKVSDFNILKHNCKELNP